MLVLGIESSCDDSSICLMNENYEILALKSQAHLECLQAYQGVMPEVVAREHCRLLPELIRQLTPSLKEIDAIAYTAGPGLAGSLLIGSHVARTLHLLTDKPLIPIHHLEGHILATLVEDEDLWEKGPVLILIVSGGHTQLVYSPERFSYNIIGKTLDDAAGEAFDKIAKHLGLGYPGGAKLSHLASLSCHRRAHLSIPMEKHSSLDFSFSGLKTQATTFDYLQHGLNLEDFCAEVEQTIVESLLIKTKKAFLEYGDAQSLVVCGGVASNRLLRSSLEKLTTKYRKKLSIPSGFLCTDNGAMIAAAAMYHLKHQGPALNRSPSLFPRWPLNQISPQI